MANYIVHKKANQYSQAHQAEVHIGKIKFKGFSGIQVDDIFVKALQKDTLLKVESAFVRLSFFDMLIFNVNIIDFKLHNTDLNIVRDTAGDNYSNFLASQNQDIEEDTIQTDEISSLNYSDQASDLLDIAFNLIPSNITITDLSIHANLKGHPLSMYLDKFEVLDHHFNSIVEVSELKNNYSWHFDGLLDPAERKIEGKWYCLDSSKVVLPYLKHKFETLISFDTLNFNFYQEKANSSLVKLKGNARVNGLILNNKRISLEDVFLNKGQIDYLINISENKIELDSSSTIAFNKMNFNPYISYEKNPTKIFTMIINKSWFEAQSLFSSFPIGLFDNLKGIKVSGELAYHFLVKIDFENIDSLQFNSELKRKNFKLIQYGETDFSQVNSPFLYTAYEKGQAVRTFEVGPNNLNYRNLPQIPAHLINAILYSEDMGFFYHNGFSKSAFRSSMVTNLRAKRFVRGGSTISMQLVKNLFLTRNKTVSRKVEEALIVWLIESNRLVSKQRMMEIYINIIEWGPMIYGANEAANFYFNKDISQINLAEAIFMASIIPKPKWFKNSFDSQANLKPSLEGFYKNVSGRLLNNNLISQQEYDQLKAKVDLLGPARLLIQIQDSIVGDSLQFLP